MDEGPGSARRLLGVFAHPDDEVLGTEFFARTGRGPNAAASRWAKAPRPRRPSGCPTPRYLRRAS
ncbi:MAG TPA: hypothetical protein VED20_16450 [Streptosporangiaceae bacterium]|nr:hypothetical protein [Streptosporangiaceae bacterium]